MLPLVPRCIPTSQCTSYMYDTARYRSASRHDGRHSAALRIKKGQRREESSSRLLRMTRVSGHVVKCTPVLWLDVVDDCIGIVPFLGYAEARRAGCARRVAIGHFGGRQNLGMFYRPCSLLLLHQWRFANSTKLADAAFHVLLVRLIRLCGRLRDCRRLLAARARFFRSTLCARTSL